MNQFLKYAKKVVFTVGQFLWVLVKSIVISIGMAFEAAAQKWVETN